jgi:hypothetical protein
VPILAVLKNQAGLTFFVGVRWAQELHTLAGVTIHEDCEIGARALLNLILPAGRVLCCTLNSKGISILSDFTVEACIAEAPRIRAAQGSNANARNVL